jgi:hypothetical protein
VAVLNEVVVDDSTTHPLPEQDELPALDDEEVALGNKVVKLDNEVKGTGTDAVGLTGAKEVTFRVPVAETEQS